MGGSWERQIRTVRDVLEHLLVQSGTHLDDESLRTFMVESENIINSRPLCADTLSSGDSGEPLTPNHILKMKPSVLLAPPGKFVQEDQYLRKRWRRVQYLVGQFWYRWRKEFLHHLQLRNKWTRPQRNMKPGDIVLISDNNLHRRDWKLRKIESIFDSDDHLIRKVKVRVGTTNLNSKGKHIQNIQFLDRPIHKLVLLIPAEY